VWARSRDHLADALGYKPALALLASLRSSGSRIIQTIHNLAPHEPRPEGQRFLSAVDSMTDGVHFFSDDHERLARADRPKLPVPSVHMPHPRYRAARRWAATTTSTIGCFGRLRAYKRTAEFAAAALTDDDPELTVLVAGHPDDGEVDQRLRALAATDARLDYRPGFATGESFWRLLASVEWVVLPYRALYSSGVLVAALQAGRRILSVTPTGGTRLYGKLIPDQWLTLPTWDDHAAVRAWRQATTSGRMPPQLTIPTWSDAAAMLAAFYTNIASRPPRPA